MSTATLAQTIAQITEEACTKKVAAERVISDFPIGKVARQGDIYICRVDAAHPHGGPLENRQLAQGTSKGSRHIAEGVGTTVYEGTTAPPQAVATPFLGPCVQSDVEFRISHPEHADVIVPAGTYQITHQMHARTLRRVQD